MAVFLMSGRLTLVALLPSWRMVTETRGRSLPELERDLTERGVG